MDLKKYIHTIANFPHQGVMFRDISPLLGNGKALKTTIQILADKAKEADVIVGPDARGFLFGTPVAVILEKPFIMIRKPGKLPGEVIKKTYNLEYGNSALEIQKDAIKPGQKVAIIDDVLATGGTTRAIVELIKELGAEINKVLFVIELTNFNGRQNFKNINIESLIKF